MKKDFKILLWLFFAITFLFLVVQKPLFLIYNNGFGGTSITFHDVVDIYAHGLPIDLATTGYMMIVPLLFIGIHWCFKEFPLRKSLIIYLLVLSAALPLGFLADASLYEFWEFKLDRMVFFYLSSPKGAFASVSIGYLMVRLLAWVFFGFFTYYLLTWPISRISFEDEIKLSPWLRGLTFILLGGILFAVIRGIRIWPNTPARAFYCNTTYYNHAALNPIFNLLYSLDNPEDDYKQFDVFDEKTIALLYDGLFPIRADSTEILINNQRPNILLVVLEGFGSCFIESLGGMPEVGVRINQLLPECIVFSNCYCGSFRTDRGIVCAVSGYLGQPTTSIMRFEHRIKNLPGLPKTLKQYGYATQGLYGGDLSFFNRLYYDT